MLGSLVKRLFASRAPDKPLDVTGVASVDERWLEETLRLRQQGANNAVVTRCKAALARAPHQSQVINLLAAALLAQGKTQEGIGQLRRAIELAPGANAHAQLGSVLAATGDFDAAVASYRAAVDADPKFVEGWNTLGSLHKVLANYDEAESCCETGLRLQPGNAQLKHTLATVLFEQARLDAAITTIRESLATEPANPVAHSALLRMLCYSDRHDPAQVFHEHQAWAARHAQALEAAALPHDNNPDPARRLRVGFVSPYLQKHAVTFFLESVIEHHDRSQLDIFLYADVARPDDYSARLQSHGAHWRKSVDLDDAGLAKMIREDEIDILVDLSGHTNNNRLLAFARKPAPVQVSWLGFPSTTGLPAIDYRITDQYCDPPGMTEHLNTEKLARLPGIYMAWRAPEGMPAVTPLPSLTNGHITFGTFHSAFKITPTVAALWARILERVPQSRLHVLAVSGASAERHIRELFAAAGIGADRLKILPRLAFDDYLAAYGNVDIALDTFPYHGATTTCFSLWMGLPVVALAGTTHASRADVSMLTNVGLPQLVAQTGDDYVDIAVALAQDAVRLADLRTNLRGMMQRSPNADGRTCARNLEQAFREMWVTWCEKSVAAR
ncbi:MAG: domain/SEC-C motif domain protein [Betaproteobacteria bacterium]|nr:domain/SEC-C motif domain protein [Betaproteobacteria bacterium]